MLDRIVMNILDVLDEIVVVSNLMLPETTLPHRFLLFALPRFGNLALGCDCTMPAEMALDQPPAGGKAGIANRQHPYTVKVLRQNHDGIDLERVMAHRVAECLAQQCDVFVGTQERTPVVGDNREKEGPTGRFGSTIVHVI
jgi:hypothetical protein